MEFVEDVIDFSLEYILIINVFLYGYSALKLKSAKSLNILTVYLGLISVNQICASYLSSIKENNLFLFHAYLVIQFICLSFFYRSMFNKYQKVFVNSMLISVGLFLSLYYGMSAERFKYFNAPEILITAIPILAYILMHMYNSLTSKGDYLFFNSGLLVYLSISSLVWILYAVSVDDLNNDILDRETSNNISFINLVSYFLLQIVIFIEWKLNISKWKTNKKL